jgi:CubicO group peptidase (beta-lactamase class C family)
MQSPIPTVIAFLWISCVVSVSPAPGRSAEVDVRNRELTTRLGQFMQTQVRTAQFSGSVLVARRGVILLSKGYGRANREWDIPNTTTTEFRIGSLTKQFTATVIMQLREKQRLDLTDSICKYLQPCPEAWSPVTLHHLLSHTSGIVNYTDSRDNEKNSVMAWTPDEIVATFRSAPLQFAPGTQEQYSNSNYFLLTLIIEKITGQRYEEVLRQ